jgi:PAS domain-containing protein
VFYIIELSNVFVIFYSLRAFNRTDYTNAGGNKMSEEKNRNILIVSMRRMPAQRLKESLEDILGNEVRISIHSYLEDGELTVPVLPKVTLASGENSYKRLLQRYPKEKIIFAKRDVALPVYFERVFLLPKGKKVLVINETYEGTLDTIRNLVDIGINYLDFKPYWQDCNITVDDDIDTAISPGMLHICPEHIKTKIDIGMRQLSISVFIKILQELQLDLSYAEKFISHNKAVLVNAYKRLSEQYKQKEKLSLSLESILHNINEAIIFVENANIRECNPAAERLLGFCKKDVLDKDINAVIGDKFWSSFVDNTSENKVLLFNNKKLYVTYNPLKTESQKNGIFTFKETSEIEKLEENVRKILYKKDSSFTAKYTFKDIIAESKNMKKLINTAKSMAKFDHAILITGESGTGKELFAQSIHNASARKNYPFVAVNFGAIPDNLVESELFGYEEGAFTGAKKSGKKGLFELAHNGTIFLDEIGNSSTWI